ncbi:VOC family protein [Antarcticibacterium arcticum]|uniref:VOC family protein n=1 Tax=Antarcticibacterium arcticum TaxID=2585771 RepID=A0A5B8YJA0_9FLAO|nr:VOC family protein [Antarcticibacterium arcticum]QED36917.1 VOC family protein [Antarcticibacterium arcticum]
MAKINPYLNFNGTAEEAFKFYHSVFGGELSEIHRFKDMPDADKITSKEQNKVMHVSLPIGNGNVLMGSDILESMSPDFKQGNNFYISINTESREESDQIFNALANGGIIEMELQQTFWGSYFGMLRDKFGINWMIDYGEESH